MTDHDPPTTTATTDEWVRGMARYWPVLVLASIIGFGAAVVYVSNRPVYYTARVALLVSQARFGEPGTLAAVTPGSYAALLRSRAIAADVIAKFRVDQAPEFLTPSRFAERRLDIAEIRGTSLLTLEVRMLTAKLAADVANAYAESAVALNRQLNQRETVATRDMVKLQLDEARARLDKVQSELLAQRETTQLELVQKDSEALLDERKKLIALEVEIAGEEARLSRLEQELASSSQRIALSRSIDSDPALLEAARERNGSGRVLDLRLKDEEVNPAFVELDKQLGITRGRLAGLRSSRARLVGELRLRSARLGKLDELYRGETRLNRLRTELEVATKGYTELADQYERARLQIASRSAELQVVDRAVPPEEPSSPPAVALLVIGTVLGLLAGAALTALLAFVSRLRSA